MQIYFFRTAAEVAQSTVLPAWAITMTKELEDIGMSFVIRIRERGGNGQKKHRDLAFGLDKGNPHNANVVPNTTLKSPASILQALKAAGLDEDHPACTVVHAATRTQGGLHNVQRQPRKVQRKQTVQQPREDEDDVVEDDDGDDDDNNLGMDELKDLLGAGKRRKQQQRLPHESSPSPKRQRRVRISPNALSAYAATAGTAAAGAAARTAAAAGAAAGAAAVTATARAAGAAAGAAAGPSSVAVPAAAPATNGGSRFLALEACVAQLKQELRQEKLARAEAGAEMAWMQARMAQLEAQQLKNTDLLQRRLAVSRAHASWLEASMARLQAQQQQKQQDQERPALDTQTPAGARSVGDGEPGSSDVWMHNMVGSLSREQGMRASTSAGR